MLGVGNKVHVSKITLMKNGLLGKSMRVWPYIESFENIGSAKLYIWFLSMKMSKIDGYFSLNLTNEN